MVYLALIVLNKFFGYLALNVPILIKILNKFLSYLDLNVPILLKMLNKFLVYLLYIYKNYRWLINSYIILFYFVLQSNELYYISAFASLSLSGLTLIYITFIDYNFRSRNPRLYKIIVIICVIVFLISGYILAEFVLIKRINFVLDIFKIIPPGGGKNYGGNVGHPSNGPNFRGGPHSGGNNSKTMGTESKKKTNKTRQRFEEINTQKNLINIIRPEEKITQKNLKNIRRHRIKKRRAERANLKKQKILNEQNKQREEFERAQNIPNEQNRQREEFERAQYILNEQSKQHSLEYRLNNFRHY